MLNVVTLIRLFAAWELSGSANGQPGTPLHPRLLLLHQYHRSAQTVAHLGLVTALCLGAAQRPAFGASSAAVYSMPNADHRTRTVALAPIIFAQTTRGMHLPRGHHHPSHRRKSRRSHHVRPHRCSLRRLCLHRMHLRCRRRSSLYSQYLGMSSTTMPPGSL